VKFNERSFVQLLGDMRSYNFVSSSRPTSRARRSASARWISTAGAQRRKTFYLPQFFKENLPLVEFCKKHLHLRPRSNTSARADAHARPRRAGRTRLNVLLTAMAGDTIAPRRTSSCYAKAWPSTSRTTGISNARAWAPWLRANLETLRQNIAQGSAREGDQILARANTPNRMHFNAEAETRS